MSILYAISIVYIAGEYCDPGLCTPIGQYLLTFSCVNRTTEEEEIKKMICMLACTF